MTDLERFHECMSYGAPDRTPNHELGVWPQAVERWRTESGSDLSEFRWDWFVAEDAIGLDKRAYIPVHYGFIPAYAVEVLEETDEYEVIRNGNGIVTRALKEGAIGGGRMCMDQYLEFPVSRPEDFADVKRRLEAAIPARYPADLDARIEAWRSRTCPLILGTNCAANGFYWRAREFLGTEALSFAWYDEPALMHEMMEFFADFIIETSRPVLERIEVDYFTLNEDFAGNAGPLLSPETFREFVLPHLTRMVEFFRAHGTKHFAVDSDGDPTPLIPLLLEAGVDVFWPIERASGWGPVELRREFGRDLRLWGGVDKREIARGPEAIRKHLRELIPVVEDGGYIPTVDHTVPPDVSWDHFRYYMDAKRALLAGEYEKL